MRTRARAAFFFETRELLRQVRDTYNRSVDETEMERAAAGARGRPAGARRSRRGDAPRSGCRRRSGWSSTRATTRGGRRSSRATCIDSPDSTDPRLVHLPARRAHPVAADRDVRLGGDPGRRHPRGRPARIGRRHRRAGQDSRRPRRRTSKKSAALPAKSARPGPRTAARPKARDADLKWTGGKAGS